MSDINKYFADKCGIELYSSKHINECGNYFYLNDVEYDYEWDIADPRCREIVRDKFHIDTEWHDNRWYATFVDYDSSQDLPEGYESIQFGGSHIDEAELTLLQAIYDARDE